MAKTEKADVAREVVFFSEVTRSMLCNRHTLRGSTAVSYGSLLGLVFPSVSTTSTSGLTGLSPASAVNSFSPALRSALSVKVRPCSFVVAFKMPSITAGSCLAVSLNLMMIVA